MTWSMKLLLKNCMQTLGYTWRNHYTNPCHYQWSQGNVGSPSIFIGYIHLKIIWLLIFTNILCSVFQRILQEIEWWNKNKEELNFISCWGFSYLDSFPTNKQSCGGLGAQCIFPTYPTIAQGVYYLSSLCCIGKSTLYFCSKQQTQVLK